MGQTGNRKTSSELRKAEITSLSDSLHFTQKTYAKKGILVCMRSFLCNIAAQIQKQCMWILQVIRKINEKSGIDVKPQFSSSKCYSKTKCN